MEQKETEQMPERSTQKLPQANELPEAWRRFYEEVQKAFVEK